MTEAADFMCPRCTSRYKLVRVRSNPELPIRLIHCRVCKESFSPTDGEYVLKYFLVDKAKKHNGIDLRMNHPPKGERRSLGERRAASRVASQRRNVPAGTKVVVRSPDTWRALERATALSTLIHQRRLTPSCGGQAPYRGENSGPGKDD